MHAPPVGQQAGDTTRARAVSGKKSANAVWTIRVKRREMLGFSDGKGRIYAAMGRQWKIMSYPFVGKASKIKLLHEDA
jgi:hypothetical protein